MSLHLSKGTNNIAFEGVGSLDEAQSLAERGIRRERFCTWVEQGEAPHPSCPCLPIPHPWRDSPEYGSWVRTASVLDLRAKAIHKCSKRATAQKTALSASEKTHSSIS